MVNAAPDALVRLTDARGPGPVARRAMAHYGAGRGRRPRPTGARSPRPIGRRTTSSGRRAPAPATVGVRSSPRKARSAAPRTRGLARFWLVDPLDGTKEYIRRNGRVHGQHRPDRAEASPVLGVVLRAGPRPALLRGERGRAPGREQGGRPPSGFCAAAGAGHAAHRSPRAGPTRRRSSRPISPLRSPSGSRRAARSSSAGWPRAAPTSIPGSVPPWNGMSRPATASSGNRAGAATASSPLAYNKPELRNTGSSSGLTLTDPLGAAPGAGPSRLQARAGQPAGSPGAASSARVLWFTGLSGSGKEHHRRPGSSRRCEAAGPRSSTSTATPSATVFPATGFTRAERDAHVRRVGYLASRLEAHGVTVVASFVSPYRESRDFVRGALPAVRRDLRGDTAGGVRAARRRRGCTPGPAAERSRNSPASTTRTRPPAHPELRIDTRATQPWQQCVDARCWRRSGPAQPLMAGSHGPSRPARTPERSHLARGVRQLQEPVHALVDRQGQHRPALAGPKGLLRPRADSAGAHRHLLQDPGDDRLPRPPGAGVEAEHDLRAERARRWRKSGPSRTARSTGSPAAGCSRPRPSSRRSRGEWPALSVQSRASGPTSSTRTPSRSPG